MKQKRTADGRRSRGRNAFGECCAALQLVRRLGCAHIAAFEFHRRCDEVPLGREQNVIATLASQTVSRKYGFRIHDNPIR